MSVAAATRTPGQRAQDRAAPRIADSTVSDLEERRRGAREARRLFESDWILQIAFYLGHQWVQVDTAGLLYAAAQDVDERVMLTDNRIRPSVRTNIARMTKTDPTWVGVPRGSSDEEIARARLRQIVFEHYWRTLNARRKLRLGLWYRENTGTGWWKLTWDRSGGEGTNVMAQKGGPVLTDSYGRPITPDRARETVPPELQAGLEERRVTFGEPRLEVKTPFEIAVDPLATDEGLETAEYLFDEAIYSPAQLARLYGGDRERYEQDARGFQDPVSARFPALTGFMERQRDARGASGRRGVKVREYWSRPGVDDPNGRHCVWTANDELLYEGPNPYPCLPYVLFNGPPSGRFYADAPSKDLISLQTERNKTISQIADNLERFGNPALLQSSEAVDPDNEWSGLPGERIIYKNVTGTPGDVPGFLTPPEFPAYGQGRLEDLDQGFRIISGQFEVSQGGVPEGVTAASAISQLQEANDTQLGPEIGSMADSLLDAGKQLLWMLKRFASDDRLAVIAGDEDAWDVYTFRGEALGVAEADEVQIGSGMPQSKAAKQAAIQFLLNMFIQNGQAPPPRELRRILRDYEVGGLEHFFGAVAKDTTQVNDEHRRMLQGTPLEINTYDDDQFHLEEHQDFQKSGRYRMLVTQPNGQMIQQIIEAHVQLHRDRLQDQANQQAAAQMLQNLPPGDPPPPPEMLAAAGGTPGPALPSAQPQPSIGG